MYHSLHPVTLAGFLRSPTGQRATPLCPSPKRGLVASALYPLITYTAAYVTFYPPPSDKGAEKKKRFFRALIGWGGEYKNCRVYALFHAIYTAAYVTLFQAKFNTSGLCPNNLQGTSPLTHYAGFARTQYSPYRQREAVRWSASLAGKYLGVPMFVKGCPTASRFACPLTNAKAVILILDIADGAQSKARDPNRTV